MIGLAPFVDLVRRRAGLSFDGDRQPVLEAAVARRMAAAGLATAGAYFTRLVGSAHEFDDLVSLLTINETYFFREAPQLALMATRLVPRLLARSDRPRPLRILSAGCSTGEEPYSIAMTLRERYGDAVRQLFRVVGCDIDQHALARAREGSYGEFSFRGVDPALKAHYFTSDGSSYTLLPAGREIVEFRPMNLLDEIGPEAGERYDIIFLRNVTIYFEAEVRRAIQERLRTLLAEDGYLIIGMAETLANDFQVMPLVSEDGLFYFARGANPQPASPIPNFALPTPAPGLIPDSAPISLPVEAPTRPSVVPPPGGGFERVLRLTWDRSYDQALAALDALEAPGGEDLRSLLVRAYILLNRKALTAAEAAVAAALAQDPWSIDALLLKGLAARHADRRDDALGWFKRTVYASHACWPAHYYLGDLHATAGNTALARNAYRAVLTLLTTASETGLKVLLPAFPASDIRFLCEHRLARLEGTPPPRNRT